MSTERYAREDVTIQGGAIPRGEMASLRWRRSLILRGLESLPVEF